MLRFVKISTTVWFSIATVHLWMYSSYGADPGPTSVLDRLRAADAAALSKFSLTFERESLNSVFLPDQGTSRRLCTMTQNDGVRGLECSTVQSQQIAYRPPGTPGYQALDYDDEGNLYLVHLRAQRTLSDAVMNETYREYSGNFVSPDRGILRESVSAMRSVYKVSDSENHYDMERCCWAAGLGFSTSLNRVLEERAMADGMIHLVADGFYGDGQLGTWRLVVDPEPGPLVRSAVFIHEGKNIPSVVCTTRGARAFGETIIAEEGRIEFPVAHPQKIEDVYRFARYGQHFDEALVARLRADFRRAALDKDVELLDYREHPPRRIGHSAPPANHPD